jgi:hypothetical protein
MRFKIADVGSIAEKRIKRLCCGREDEEKGRR